MSPVNYRAAWSTCLLALGACLLTLPVPVRGDEPADADGIAYFETHIRPLLAKRCYSCHSGRAGKDEGGLRLDSRAGWETGGDNGPALVGGDVENSLILRAVRYDDPDLQMPPDRPLPAEDVARIEQWIRRGAPAPADEAVLDRAERDPSDPVAGRTHWAFQPLSKTSPPAGASPRPLASPIDAYVLDRLRQAGLEPAPPASQRVLVRRVSFALTGLPPSPAQVEAFLADDDPLAYERLVDELLASPQFGERWGRHWLDLARYADSNGLDENFLFREAWRYRNWVIDAINDDQPFDQFLTHQLAGDLLPADSIEERDRQRIASGFLLIGPKVLLGNKDDRQRMEIADELIDTIGRAVLGQTLGCARCHDHKFDPVPTADYYALAGILTSTQVMERRHMLNQQRVMERLVGLGSDGETLDGEYETYWREIADTREQLKQAVAALQLLKEPSENIEEFDAKWSAIIKDHSESIAPGAADDSQPLASRRKAQQALVAELTTIVQTPRPIPPRAMVPVDRETPADEAIRLSGQFDLPGETVPRGFLQVLSEGPVTIPADRSGRLELSQWLSDCESGAGVLTARVLANRVWHHLVGRGLVRTVDNFGRTGEAPTHPELLDHLASELIASGWSLKALVRQIALSDAFRRGSQFDAAGDALDPENTLLWRAHRRRLDPESWRDAMLSAAGILDLTPMDSTVDYLGDQATAVGANKNRRRTDFPCRSVYLPVIRNDLPELFDVFDFADPQTTTGLRPQTMVATQGLFALNNELVVETADALSRRVLKDTSGAPRHVTVERLYALLFADVPRPDEVADTLAFVDQMERAFEAENVPDAEARAWSVCCQALFASSRFQILE